jgi:hypothetical protein
VSEGLRARGLVNVAVTALVADVFGSWLLEMSTEVPTAA